MDSDEGVPYVVISLVALCVCCFFCVFCRLANCVIDLISNDASPSPQQPPSQQLSQQQSRTPSRSQPLYLGRGAQGMINFVAPPSRSRSQPPIITTPSLSNGVQSMFDFLAPPPPPPPSTTAPLQPQAAFNYDEESGMPNVDDEEEKERKRQEEEDRKRKRLELVRGRLQFRKILPRSTATRSSKKPTTNVVNHQKQQGENGPLPSAANGNGVGSNKIHRAAVRKLREMGYSPSVVTKALTAVGGSNVDAAANWILENPPNHEEDKDRAKPRTKTTTSTTTRTRIQPIGKTSNVTSGEVCSICLEPYGVGDTIARLQQNQCREVSQTGQSGKRCEHWFHDECIIGWLESKDHCPLCRVNMIHDADSSNVDSR